jgi:thiol-disulfide isomerase/thioredoxin
MHDQAGELMKLFVFIVCMALPLVSQERPVTVVPINQEQLRHLILNRNGNVLFLNIWATWCKPCTEEFPDIIAVAEKYRQKKSPVEFVAVSADYSDEIESLILPFLKKFPTVPMTLFVADVTSMDAFITSVDSAWSGAVPATFVFSPEGKKERMMIGQHSQEQFKQQIDSVLEQLHQ